MIYPIRLTVAYLLSSCLPVFDEVCSRSMNFASTCMSSSLNMRLITASDLVSVVRRLLIEMFGRWLAGLLSPLLVNFGQGVSSQCQKVKKTIIRCYHGATNWLDSRGPSVVWETGHRLLGDGQCRKLVEIHTEYFVSCIWNNYKKYFVFKYKKICILVF